jgi:hypothetical protein
MKQIRNAWMVLITKSQYGKLVKAGYSNKKPIIKLFLGSLTWLVTGIEDGILYGYADLSMGCVEWGSLCYENELPEIRKGPFYLERDRNWEPKENADYLNMDSLIGV